MKKLINISVLGSLLVATAAFAHDGEVHEAVYNAEAQIYESLRIGESVDSNDPTLQPAGTKTDYEAINTGTVKIGEIAPPTNFAPINVPSVNVSEFKLTPKVTPLSPQPSSESAVTITGTHFENLIQVRGWDPIKKEEAQSAVLKVLEKTKDENIARAVAEPEKVEVRYKRPAKLFGFLPVAYQHAFTLDGKGQLSHGRPWWLIFATDDAAQFGDDVKKAYQNNQSNLEFLKLQNIIQRQLKALEILTNVLKAQNDAAQSSIQNISRQ